MQTNKEIYITTVVERIWHIIHALSVLLLFFTGFHIHFPDYFPLFGSMENAVNIHNFLGFIIVADIVIWLFYIAFSRRIKFYLPVKSDLSKGFILQVKYYLNGIFKKEDSPYKADGKTIKFNPLQKFSYIGLMFFIVPVQIITGFIMYYYSHSELSLTMLSMIRFLAFIHTGIGYLVAVFLIVHIYLATTGPTPAAHFKMMITGKEIEH